jgi:hypothetical protein
VNDVSSDQPPWLSKDSASTNTVCAARTAGLAASKQADVRTKAEREHSFIDMCKNKDSELEGKGVSAILQHFIRAHYSGH